MNRKIIFSITTVIALFVSQSIASINVEKTARQVTIYRDTYGVPHVFGKTDATTVFGFAYAQAEDYFWLLEDNYIRAIGRASEVYGEQTLDSDRLNSALEIPKLAQAEYRRMDAHTRSICDAFAAGLNYYLQKNPQVKPRLLTKFEPWHPLAFIRYNYYQNGFSRAPELRPFNLQTAQEERAEAANQGSNGWAISPAKSATGNAMLFINPHLPFFGAGQVYEGHVHSEQGWNFTGYTRFGFPLPYVGHNENGGWVSTDNAADLADVYAETFDDSSRPLAYRYGDGYKIATERIAEIKVKTANGFETRKFTMRRTHHGPVISVRDGKSLAIKMAKFEDDGWLKEWDEMTKAKSLNELKRAMSPLNMNFGNVMYADRQGNTFYLYNGAMPRRNPQFDWRKPVDGSNPATEWQGYHTIDELPQLTNPKSGWMQNCNTTPFLLNDSDNPNPRNFPNYMVREGDNLRGAVSRKILAVKSKFTFAEWSKLAFDNYVIGTENSLPQLLEALKKNLEKAENVTLREAYAELSNWNHRSTNDSIAMTLFSLWRDKLGNNQNSTEETQIAALEEVLKDLQHNFGSWKVGWGEISRLQRIDESKGETFNDNNPSVATPGVNGADGAVFTFYARTANGQKKRYGTNGGTYISVVEFAPKVKALSVHVFGSSGNPKSKHFMDQSPLYARGEFKPAWFTLEEIKANLERAYQPGKE